MKTERASMEGTRSGPDDVLLQYVLEEKQKPRTPSVRITGKKYEN
jgi:hypothetical protein